MASTVMRNGINRFQWQRPFREMASTVSNGNDRLRKGNLRRRYHERLFLEAWHINCAHAPLNRDDSGLLPDSFLPLL